MDKALTLGTTSQSRILIDSYYSITGSIMDSLKSIGGSSNIRRLTPKDNEEVKDFINRLLLKRGGIGFGQNYYDTELSDLAEHYRNDTSNFLVQMDKKEVTGTIAMTKSYFKGSTVCALKKIFSRDESVKDMEAMIEKGQLWAIKNGYSRCIAIVEKANINLNSALMNCGFYVDLEEGSQVYLTCAV